MIQLILFLAIFIFAIQKNDSKIEGVTDTVCCGNIKQSLIDGRCSGDEVPEAVKRCYPERNRENYDCFDCGTICDGENGSKASQCVPTNKGGYCKLSETINKYYDGNTFKTLNKNKGKKLTSIRVLNKYINDNLNKCDPFYKGVDEEDVEKRRGGRATSSDFDELDSGTVRNTEDTGISTYVILGILFLLGLLGFGGYFIYNKKFKKPKVSSDISPNGLKDLANKK